MERQRKDMETQNKSKRVRDENKRGKVSMSGESSLVINS